MGPNYVAQPNLVHMSNLISTGLAQLVDFSAQPVFAFPSPPDPVHFTDYLDFH